ncbi:hypothetical protein QUF76_17770 [Desulfobacterales bacterium HSG16]|nr:hypothetical protein [Desulfobacterales bacterium HSG16]
MDETPKNWLNENYTFFAIVAVLLGLFFFSLFIFNLPGITSKTLKHSGNRSQTGQTGNGSPSLNGKEAAVLNNIESENTVTNEEDCCKCGDDHGLPMYDEPTILCSSGTPSDVTLNGTSWSWTCSDPKGETKVKCRAVKIDRPPKTPDKKSTPKKLETGKDSTTEKPELEDSALPAEADDIFLENEEDEEKEDESDKSDDEDTKSVTGTVYVWDPDFSYTFGFNTESCTDHLLTFRNFTTRAEFESAIFNGLPEYMFIPQWYYNAYTEEKGLRPLLRAKKNGKSQYNKLLLTLRDSDVDPTSPDNRPIAMTSLGADSDRALNLLVFKISGLEPERFNKIIVEAPLEAISLLYQHSVDMALIPELAMDYINAVAPLSQSTETLKTSSAVNLPIFCYIKNNVSIEELHDVRDMFTNQSEETKCSNIQELLKFDEWEAFSLPPI